MAGVQELVGHIDEVILWLSFRIADLSTHNTKDSSGRHSTEQTSKTRRSKTSVLRSALVPDTLALSVSCFQPMCLYHCSHFPSRVAASGQLKCQQHKVLIRVHSCSLRSKSSTATWISASSPLQRQSQYEPVLYTMCAATWAKPQSYESLERS